MDRVEGNLTLEVAFCLGKVKTMDTHNRPGWEVGMGLGEDSILNLRLFC